MNITTCHACTFPLDVSDNFCRSCGTPAGHAPLPAVRRDATPSVWQPHVSPVVKGAAVMAAGTVGQFVFRRVVSGLLSGGKRPKANRVSIRRPNERDGLVDEAQIITETIMMRRVRIRRQA
jgi:hypothetical protein